MRRVDADRGDAAGWSGRRAPGACALTHSARTLPGGVLPLERGQVHHPDREVQRPHLGRLLDGALLERIDPLVDADLVDATDAVE